MKEGYFYWHSMGEGEKRVKNAHVFIGGRGKG